MFNLYDFRVRGITSLNKNSYPIQLSPNLMYKMGSRLLLLGRLMLNRIGATPENVLHLICLSN